MQRERVGQGQKPGSGTSPSGQSQHVYGRCFGRALYVDIYRKNGLTDIKRPALDLRSGAQVRTLDLALRSLKGSGPLAYCSMSAF